MKILYLFLKRFLKFIFRERGREGEREEEKYQCAREISVGCLSHSTGNLARNPGMCPGWKLNWRLLGSQASA